MTVYLADIKCAFLNSTMKEGEIILARPHPEWNPELKTKGNDI